MTFFIILFVAAVLLFVFACCKMSSECEMEEQKRYKQRRKAIAKDICALNQATTALTSNARTERKTNSMNKIDYAERVAVYESAIARYGWMQQLIVAIEELSECQKEICKYLRAYNNKEQIAEEVADATIMLEQLRIIFDINEKVCMYMDEKVQRLADRLNGGK